MKKVFLKDKKTEIITFWSPKYLKKMLLELTQALNLNGRSDTLRMLIEEKYKEVCNAR